MFFQQEAKFAYLYQDEYFVNGDPINTSTTQLSRMTTAIDRSLALDTRGMPAPLNTARAVGGFAAQTQMGFAGPSSSFQRINTVCAKDKSYKKSIWRLELRGNTLKMVQHYPIMLCEKTASLPKVADIINHELQVEDELVFVDSQYLQITDSTLTRGNDYWKGQRKVYFLPKEEFLMYESIQDAAKPKSSKNSKRSRQLSNEDDSNDCDDDAEYFSLGTQSSN